MPDSPDIPESTLWELDAAMSGMQDQVALNQRVYDATEKTLGEIARRFYPGIGDWEPEQLRRLADRISRVACNFCLELDNLDCASAKAKAGE